MNYQSYMLKDVYEESKRNNFSVISTFAGGGGSSTGYKLAGGNILAINEFMEHAQRTYLANYPDVEGKVLTDSIVDLTGQDFLDIANIKPVGLINISILILYNNLQSTSHSDNHILHLLLLTK